MASPRLIGRAGGRVGMLESLVLEFSPGFLETVLFNPFFAFSVLAVFAAEKLCRISKELGQAKSR